MPKLIPNEIIQYTGFKDITPEQKRLLDKISNENYIKIKRLVHNNITSISIHLKTYHKTGKQQKYSIHAKAIAPTRIYVSTKAVDWDFAKTLHKAFKDLKMVIKKGLKESKAPKKLPEKYKL